MTAAGMAQKIVNELKTINPAITGQVETDLKTAWTGICQGVLDEFSANSVVASGAFQVLDPVSGVLPVTGIGGPVT